MAATARPVGVLVSIPSRMARNRIRRSLSSVMVLVTSATDRPSRSIAVDHYGPATGGAGSGSAVRPSFAPAFAPLTGIALSPAYTFRHEQRTHAPRGHISKR